MRGGASTVGPACPAGRARDTRGSRARCHRAPLRMYDRLLFNAALSRFLLVGYIVVVLPVMYPGVESQLWILVPYIAAALAQQWMIARELGGRTRAAVGGIIDVAMISVVVHRTGSVTTGLVSLYFYASTVNTLVVGRQMGFLSAAAAGVMYALLTILPVFDVIDYGPFAVDAVTGVAPTLVQALSASLLVIAPLLTTNLVVGHLVSLNERREQELLEMNSHLSELSVRDPLTGLFNRRAFFDALKRGLSKAHHDARRRDDDTDRGVAVAMLDLDGFKRINDQRGHGDGDTLLGEIAAEIRDTVREDDLVARYGGDEFVVLFLDVTAEDARAGIDRVVASVRDVGARFDPERAVTVSAGLAFAEVDETAEKLLARADGLAYGAKRAGGDRWQT